MHKESVVTGVVVDPKTGAPLPGVDVITVTDPAMLRHYSPQPVRRKLDGISGVVKTDDKGAFRIGELTDGDLQIYVAHPQRADIPPIPVKLQTAATVEGLRIEYPKGGSLHGKLTGAPVKAGWRVRISRMPEPRNHFGSTYGLSDDQRYESVPVAADGSFSFHGLSRANYLLSLSMPYPHGALEIGIEPIRMRSSDVERSFDISEDLPGRLKGRVKVEGGTFTPGRLMLIATDATRTNMNYSYSGRPNLQGDFALLDGRGEFDLPVSEGQYYLSVVDLMTRLTLLQGTTAVSVRATQTTPHDLLVAVAPVTVELQPERDGIKIGITRIEIRADHPKPAQGRNFGIVMGQQNHDSGVGLLVRPGTTEVQLILPIVPCKLLARSDAHNLDPKVHQYNFPAQGEVELTPKPGQSNKIELTVGEPQIDILGEAKAAGEGAKAGAAKARAAKTIEVKRR
jgi:hypothetical protein